LKEEQDDEMTQMVERRSRSTSGSMVEENRQLVADEPVEFEK
jgi:hypothetical protein